MARRRKLLRWSLVFLALAALAATAWYWHAAASTTWRAESLFEELLKVTQGQPEEPSLPTRVLRRLGLLKPPRQRMPREVGAELAAMGRDAMPTLRKAMLSGDVPSQWAAMSVLRRSEMDPQVKAEAAPELRSLLASGDPDVRSEALAILGEMGERSPETIAVCRRSLEDENPFVRVAAALSLWQLTENAQGSLPVLVPALTDDEAIVRGLAAKAIVLMAPGDKQTVDALVGALEYESKQMYGVFTSITMLTLMKGLVLIGPEARPAVPALRRILNKEGDARVQMCAAEALWRITDDPAESLPTILNMLDDRLGRNIEALEVLGRMGPEARSSTNAVANMFGDDSEAVRLAAAETLGKIRDERALWLLMAVAADDESPRVRDAAAESVTWLGLDPDSPLHRSIRGKLLQRMQKLEMADRPLSYAMTILARGAGTGVYVHGVDITPLSVTTSATDLTYAEAWCRILVDTGAKLGFRIAHDGVVITALEE